MTIDGKTTMKALVLKAPYKVAYADVPMPKIVEDGDVIVKVLYTGLCGSDLHWYRGHQSWSGADVILGHEFIGVVAEVGPSVKLFKPGDKVVAPFTCQCGECFYCGRGASSRCEKVKVYGTAAFTGVQSEFAYVAMGDSTLVHAPEDLSPQSLILMADIFPTGYWVARNAFRMLQDAAKASDTTCLVIGCGPVGLCAITAATHFFGKVYATDPVEARRQQAVKQGASRAFALTDLDEAVKTETNGRGFDAVLEVVGNARALDVAMTHVRTFGAVASCGVHAGASHDGEPTITRQALYNKNLSIQFGRCPVRSVFDDALACLRQHDKLFSSFVQHTVPLARGPEFYAEFEAQRILKTIFTP
ncbi:hypothetical protein OIO90_003778 [Microbotryomycetes sp. JL221]|nr:hypothetical protein OIO90_003778 [Microbotryomycetes sp. JL221]